MTRDPIIEAIGRQLCEPCRDKLESRVSKGGLSAPVMAVFAMRKLCAPCKQAILQGAARRSER